MRGNRRSDLGVRRLERDRRRGASELGQAALEWIDSDAGGSAYVGSGQLARWAEGLESAQPSMGAFRAWADDLRAWSHVAAEIPTRRLRRWLDRWRATLEREEDRVPRRAARELRSYRNVVTLSESSTVLHALSIEPSHREVTVLRSLPGGEGRRMALQLRRAGIRTRLLEDSNAEEAVSAADLVLVGADAVLADASLVHKVGTRALAARARTHRVPFVSITGASKFVDRSPASFGTPTRLFDRTPSHWITAYWSESGALGPATFVRWAAACRPSWKQRALRGIAKANREADRGFGERSRNGRREHHLVPRDPDPSAGRRDRR